MTSIDPLNQILASKIEGRTANVRYRQDQLQKLHNALLQNLDEIQGALHKDTGYTRAETVFEVATSLNAVRDHYASLNFDAAHNAEYRVANGQEASDRTVGCGIVYLEETSREFPLFGAIAPLAAALAAGCVVLIKVRTVLATLSYDEIAKDARRGCRDHLLMEHQSSYRSRTACSTICPRFCARALQL